MSTPPPNLDTRELPYGWTQQYNWEYRQWFYVNTREHPPRSSWEHPLGPIPQAFAPPACPPPDRSYNRSPYGGPPLQGYERSYGPSPQGYYNNPTGGYHVGGAPSYASYGPGYSQRPPEERVVYVEEERKQKKGFGLGSVALAGGAGLVGGALLENAFENHDDREREMGYDQGYDDGFEDNQGFDGGW